MKLTVFGGTVRNGKHLVEQVLSARHQVTIFTRIPAKLGIQHNQLTICEGDI